MASKARKRVNQAVREREAAVKKDVEMIERHTGRAVDKGLKSGLRMIHMDRKTEKGFSSALPWNEINLLGL